MPISVMVKGVGKRLFPDDMAPEQIREVLRTKYSPDRESVGIGYQEGKAVISDRSGVVGEISFDDLGDKVVIKRSDVSKPGQGIGTKAYQIFVDDQLKKGKLVESDSVVSDPAGKVYKKLQGMGYKVESPEEVFSMYSSGQSAKTTASREHRMSRGPGESFSTGPVFRVTGKAGAAGLAVGAGAMSQSGEAEAGALGSLAKKAKDFRPMFGEDNRLTNLNPQGGMASAIKAANPRVDLSKGTVKAYRATVGNEIRPNDFVALDKNIAKQHMENLRDRGEKGQILEVDIPTSDIMMANDATEFIYAPKAIAGLTTGGLLGLGVMTPDRAGAAPSYVDPYEQEVRDMADRGDSANIGYHWQPGQEQEGLGQVPILGVEEGGMLLSDLVNYIRDLSK